MLSAIVVLSGRCLLLSGRQSLQEPVFWRIIHSMAVEHDFRFSTMKSGYPAQVAALGV